MNYILCYGDSNTWGCMPNTFGRYEFPDRWPGVMQGALGAQNYHVYENALNGRTTVFEDPIEEGRCGRTNFEVTLMQNAPLDLIIIMLGVNDLKNRFAKSPWDIGWGMDLLAGLAQKSGCGRKGKSPAILIVPPVYLNDQWGSSLHHTVFSQESIEKGKQLPEVYQIIAQRNGAAFFDPNTVVDALGGDGIHLSREHHHKLGIAMAQQVKAVIG